MIVITHLSALVNNHMHSFPVMGLTVLMLSLTVTNFLLVMVEQVKGFGVKTFGVIKVILHVIHHSLVQVIVMIVTLTLVAHHLGLVQQIHITIK